jgi:hypothetical protein
MLFGSRIPQGSQIVDGKNADTKRLVIARQQLETYFHKGHYLWLLFDLRSLLNWLSYIYFY